MIRGTIVWVNLADADPPEMGKVRPAIIISNSQQNSVLETVVVVPLSSRPPAIWPLRLELPASGKRKKGFAIVPAIRQVDKQRLLETIGIASEAFMHELAHAVQAYLGG